MTKPEDFLQLESNRPRFDGAFLHFAIAAPKNLDQGRPNDVIALIAMSEEAIHVLTNDADPDPLAAFNRNRDRIVRASAIIFLEKAVKGNANVEIRQADIEDLDF